MNTWVWRISLIIFVGLGATTVWLLAPPIASPITAQVLPTSKPQVVSTMIPTKPVSIRQSASATVLQTLVWQGKGEDQSTSSLLEPGLYRFTIQHSSATPFAAFLLNDADEHLALLANANTPINGDQLYGIRATDHYHAHVIADDDWKVSVEPIDRGTPSIPFGTLRGTGLSVQGAFELAAGDHTISWQHDGSLGFEAVLWRDDGQTRVEIVQAAASITTGQATVNIPQPGHYWLMIQADGAWRLASQSSP